MDDLARYVRKLARNVENLAARKARKLAAQKVEKLAEQRREMHHELEKAPYNIDGFGDFTHF